MGIQGLLPFLKAIHTPVNIADFPGATVAIDAYCWLHKGAFSCAEKLALGEKTDQYVYYCMKYVEYMLRKNLKPILVFDGGHLKSKADVEKTRRERRELHRKKAAQFLREGKRSEAKECLQRCVDITPQMALELMNACRDRGVDCIVAPYEADAQLAYLNLRGIADIIVTEDSDLLLFGCEKIIFKMDLFGNGTLIERSRLNEVLSIKGGFYTFEKFRHMCILSGCDYLPSIPGIGLAKACKVMKTARQPDIRQLLRKLPTYLKANMTVTDEYIEGFIRADNTFLYQLVFDPTSRELCPLNPYPPELEPASLDYAGGYLPEEKAYQIAVGNIDVHNHKCIAYFDPDSFVPKNAAKPKFRHQLSIWDRNYCIKSASPCKEIQPTKEGRNVSLHNKEEIIKVRPFKRSPAKRIRSGVDQSDLKLDEDLISLYADADENANPDVRKVRSLETALSSTSSGNVLREEESEHWKTSTQNTSNIEMKDENFDNVNDGEQLNQASDSEEEKPKISRKRKMSVSPWKPSAANIGEDAFRMTSTGVPDDCNSVPSPSRSRNVFAVPGGALKVPKFDLNTPAVHVRSRYFVAACATEHTSTSKQASPVIKKQTSPKTSLPSPAQKLRKISLKPSLSSTSQKDSLPKGQKSIQAMFENVPVQPQPNIHQEQKPKPASKAGILRFVSPISSELPTARDCLRNLKQTNAKNDYTEETSCLPLCNKGHVPDTRQSVTGLEKFQSRFSPSCSIQTSSKRSSGSAFNWSNPQTGLGVVTCKLSVAKPSIGQSHVTHDGQQIKVETDSQDNETHNDSLTQSDITSQSSLHMGRAAHECQGTYDLETYSSAADTCTGDILTAHDQDLHNTDIDGILTAPDLDLPNTESPKMFGNTGVQSDAIKGHLVMDEMVDVPDDVIEVKSCSYSDFLKMLDQRSQSGTSESAAEIDDDNLASGKENSQLQTCSDGMDSSSSQILNDGSQPSEGSDSLTIACSPDLETRGTALSLLEEDHMPDRIDSTRTSCGDSHLTSGCGHDDVIDLTDAEADSQSSCTSILSTSSNSNISRQAKCRVSGLSRNKGKSSVKKSSCSMSGQRSIKDLMSKFQYKRHNSLIEIYFSELWRKVLVVHPRLAFDHVPGSDALVEQLVLPL